MKINIYYHILLINNWEAIVKGQLISIVRSGLYDECDAIKIGALGYGIVKLERIVKQYDKCEIVRYNIDKTKYEFWTQQIMYNDAINDKPFYALYIHTKGVTYPNHPGGDYWRHHMMKYNVGRWKECIKYLRKGFDTCGCKWLNTGANKSSPHYSGTFFWAKSTYINRLPSPDTLNVANRYEAEFWIGKSKPKAHCINDEFIDYNSAPKVRNYVHTLAYNMPSETEKSVELLYKQNDNFEHYIIDLGFPLLTDAIPRDIKESCKQVSEAYQEMAAKYGSHYVKLPNVGVSQNWTAVYNYLGLEDNDVLIGADPDERPLHDGWVNAMGDVLRSKKKIGVVSLTMPGQLFESRNVAGYNVGFNKSGNWALIGFFGGFMREMGEVPYPQDAKRYGYIESFVKSIASELEWNLAFLNDYQVRHTDYECGDIGSSRLLREWKNLIIFDREEFGQITLNDYLVNYDDYKKRQKAYHELKSK